MVSQTRSEAVIALGKRLAAQLDDDDDIATSWLSHLLAEHLTAVETASGPEAKAASEVTCTDLILKLWRHQAEFPKGTRPFRDLDAVMRTLESLDVDLHPFHFFPSVFRAAEGEAVPDASRKWLEVARGVDTTARQIIRAALGQAVEGMGETMQDWVALARVAAAAEPAESTVIRFVLDRRDDDDAGLARRQRELNRLNNFIELAKIMAEELEAGLE